MILYHMSPAKNLDSIMENGIRKGSMGCVFACDNPGDCLKFAITHFVDNAVIFAFFAKKQDVVESFDHNITYFQCKCYSVLKDVNPSKIINYTLYDVEELIRKIQNEIDSENKTVDK